MAKAWNCSHGRYRQEPGPAPGKAACLRRRDVGTRSSATRSSLLMTSGRRPRTARDDRLSCFAFFLGSGRRAALLVFGSARACAAFSRLGFWTL